MITQTHSNKKTAQWTTDKDWSEADRASTEHLEPLGNNDS